MGAAKHQSELQEIAHAETEESDILAQLCDDTQSAGERLENEFTLSEKWTINDSLMEGRILGFPTEDRLQKEGVETDSDQIHLMYWLPIEGVIIENFNKPVPWNPDKFSFAAIVEELGYDSSSADQIKGENIVLKKAGRKSDNKWEIVDPEKRSIIPGDYTFTGAEPNLKNVLNRRVDLNSVISEYKTQIWYLRAKTIAKGTILGLGLASVIIFVGGTIIFAVENFLNAIDSIITPAEPSTSDSEYLLNPEALSELIKTMFSMMFPVMLFSFFYQIFIRSRVRKDRISRR